MKSPLIEETDIVEKNNKLPIVVDPVANLVFILDAIRVDVIMVLP